MHAEMEHVSSRINMENKMATQIKKSTCNKNTINSLFGTTAITEQQRLTEIRHTQ